MDWAVSFSAIEPDFDLKGWPPNKVTIGGVSGVVGLLDVFASITGCSTSVKSTTRDRSLFFLDDPGLIPRERNSNGLLRLVPHGAVDEDSHCLLAIADASSELVLGKNRLDCLTAAT